MTLKRLLAKEAAGTLPVLRRSLIRTKEWNTDMPNFYDRLLSSRTHAAVTPSDSTTLGPFTWLYVGGTGDVVVTAPNGVDATYKAVPTGTQLRVAGTKVKATGTTATLIVAVFE